MNIRYFIAFMLFFPIYGAVAQGINFEKDLTFFQALEKAKNEGKVVFVDCYTTWCGPCRKLTNETFPDARVGSFFNSRFVNIKVDMEKEVGVEVRSKFSVPAYPTLLWVNPDGTLKHRAVGFLTPDRLLAEAQKASDTLAGQLDKMRAEYNNGKRDINFVNDYLNVLTSTGGSPDSELKDFINSLSANDTKQEKYTKTIYNATNDVRSPGVSYLLKNKTFVQSLVGENVFTLKLGKIADKGISEAVVKKDAGLLQEALLLLKNSGLKNADERVAYAQVEYASRVEDWTAFDKYATEYLKKYAAKNDKQLSDIAWTYYLNISDKKQLEKAQKWAYEAVNLKNNTENNTVYAYLNYKLGNLKEAELACDYALLRAKEDGGSDLSAKGLKDLLLKEKK